MNAGRSRALRVLTIIGTRPEVIKMAPVIRALNARPRDFSVTNVLTGQHRDMCAPYLKLFGLRTHHDLAIMRKGQSLDGIVERILHRLPPILNEAEPDVVLVQGDTTSAFAAALAAFHRGVPIGHVEAGLRTNDKLNPFPEEMNRRLVGALAELHFAPTPQAAANLKREGIESSRIFVTGNTVIDAMRIVARRNTSLRKTALAEVEFQRHRVLCVTTHRRESFGLPLQGTLGALRQLVERYDDIEIVLPVHYNPNVRGDVLRLLGDLPRVHLVEPLPYELFVQLLTRSFLVLTDSGGIQEEAPGLGKPVLVLRETTERPEGIKAGTAKLVGTDPARIVRTAARLLDDPKAYRKMAQAVNPYGDGQAAERIANILRKHVPPRRAAQQPSNSAQMQSR
jgi:UDP-N-acetylglucosamine 2-epimerase (non-hydrolysing)